MNEPPDDPRLAALEYAVKAATGCHPWPAFAAESCIEALREQGFDVTPVADAATPADRILYQALPEAGAHVVRGEGISGTIVTQRCNVVVAAFVPMDQATDSARKEKP